MGNDESTFWVLPGKALQKEFCAVSRVQKKMNLEVSKWWGFYMPYAPEYAYTEVENNLERWVRQDILSSFKLDEYSLVHPDSTTRKEAKQNVTRRAPERHLSVDVPLEDGGSAEKPHPRYYISFEHTKNWFAHMI
ncbi:hypothetical protein XELAEV_18008603mg [Xenopus laevis]|uniref:Uncharacterized protein n=1 Tax=Xenopus laevis TaxID=8355 RepID=A0A974E4W7_XENLA|nr:hypothetical protein XELAEV_18008603mg [Xenopus laevis]